MADSLSSLAADLLSATVRANAALQPLMLQQAKEVQRSWRATWPWNGSPHLPALGMSVTYSIEAGPGGVTADIGPDKNLRQGALGNLIEFGSVNNPPHPGGDPAVVKQAPIMETAMMALGMTVLAGGGGTTQTTGSRASRFNTDFNTLA